MTKTISHLQTSMLYSQLADFISNKCSSFHLGFSVLLVALAVNVLFEFSSNLPERFCNHHRRQGGGGEEVEDESLVMM